MGFPPGLNPVFNKHQGKLNLGLTWLRPCVPDQVAERFTSLIESEIFEE